MTEPRTIDAAHAYVTYSRADDGTYDLSLGHGVHVVGPLQALRGFAETVAHRVDHALATADAGDPADRSPVGHVPGVGWSAAARQLAEYRATGELPAGPLRELPPGDPELAEVGAHWQAVREAEAQGRRGVQSAVIAAVAGGMSESEAARLAGVDRMTVRAWLGKR